MMHELGHNLNLGHGGGDNINCKPDYQSIMSYAYQVIGLTTLNGSLFFDYSRQVLPTLNENTLNETTGLGATTYRARWFAPANNLDIILGRQTVNRYCDGTPRATPVVPIDSNAVSGPLNWDNDVNGVISASVSTDVNDSGLNDTYSGYNDWQNIDLHHVSSGYAFSEGEIANIDGEIANGEIANFENGEIANIADGEIANFDSNGEINFELAQSLAVPPSPTSLARARECWLHSVGLECGASIERCPVSDLPVQCRDWIFGNGCPSRDSGWPAASAAPADFHRFHRRRRDDL